MARVLLIVPSATYRVADFLAAARALDVEVVIATDQADAVPSVAGPKAISLPVDDPAAASDAIVAHDLVTPLDAVVAVDDVGTLIAAQAAQRLGLRHNPPDAVAATRDKLAMRGRLAGAEVSQPAFAALPPRASPDRVKEVVRGVGLPCVVKPTSLSASQGVLRADTAEEAVATARRVSVIAASAGVDPSAPLLVERFVTGPEVAVEGMVTAGDLRVLAVFDKPDPLEGPAFEETMYLTPSRLDGEDLAAVRRTVTDATRGLGLLDGPIHAELRVERGRASVIELAARTIGGLCARALSFAAGRSLEELVLCNALGLPTPPTAALGASGVLMIPIPRAGRLVAVNGLEEALTVPGVTDIQITIAPGRTVVPVPEGNRYLGFAFARDRDPARVERVERALRRAWETLDVRVAPEPSAAHPTT